MPFLDGDSSDYFCAILRFTIQTGNSLPVFIPRVELGQNDINKTVYKITLRRAASNGTIVEGSANVMYRPEDDTAKLPAPPLTSQDFSSNYYYLCL